MWRHQGRNPTLNRSIKKRRANGYKPGQESDAQSVYPRRTQTAYIRSLKSSRAPATAHRCMFTRMKTNISSSWRAPHASRMATRSLMPKLEGVDPAEEDSSRMGQSFEFSAAHRCGYFSRRRRRNTAPDCQKRRG